MAVGIYTTYKIKKCVDLDECKEPAQGRVRLELAGRHEVRKTEVLQVRSSTLSNKGPAVLSFSSFTGSVLVKKRIQAYPVLSVLLQFSCEECFQYFYKKVQ